MRHSSFVLLACLSIWSLASACDKPAAPQNPDEDVDNSGASAADQETFYVVTRRDVRKCAAPMCGGFFVKRVNQDTTVCADGTEQAECYVGALDVSVMGLDAAAEGELREAFGQRHALVRGAIAAGGDPKFAQIGTLFATEGWLGRAGAEPKGMFYRLLGVNAKCRAMPCPSGHAFRLNTGWDALIAGIELEPTGAPEEVRSAAIQAMYETPEGLLVAATPTTVSGDNGTMKALVASEFYTRVVRAGNPECGGIRGLACADSHFCEPSQCGGADIGGRCVAKPEMCPMHYQPVCGCDGKTYGNDCARQGAGVGLAHEGECAASAS